MLSQLRIEERGKGYANLSVPRFSRINIFDPSPKRLFHAFFDQTDEINQISQNVRYISFCRISNKGSNVIRVSSIRKSKKGELTIKFGYMLNKNGFDLKPNLDQEIVFAVPARLSDKTKKTITLFIRIKVQDGKGTV